jgi:protein TonB
LIPSAPSSPGGSDGTPNVAPTKPVIFADNMPQFPGGKEALEKYLKKHIQFTPMAMDAGAEGKVYISFVVDVDGSIQNVKILNDKVGYGCAQIAVNVIKNMPTWTPGNNNGHLVPVQLMQPIDFQR